MAKQVPSIGRIVAYHAYGTPGGEFPVGAQRAAIVTEVDEPGNPISAVGLCVMNPSGLFFNQHCAHGTQGGQWEWLTYVAPVTE